MKLESLKQLYHDQLRDLYDAENRILKALPKMASTASSNALKAAFEKHLVETQGHVDRLDEIFHGIGESPSGKTCLAMKGLVAEGEETIQEDAEPSVKDAALIAAAQRVEHYEMAGYGTVMAYAKVLNDTKALGLLGQTLEEEKKTDAALTDLAESSINIEAA
jgi:ferritin-like metal-binding protein YciE